MGIHLSFMHLPKVQFFTLLSSITVFSDSIHIGSMSPSSTIHFGELFAMFAKSLIATENNPKKIKETHCSANKKWLEELITPALSFT